MSKEQKILFLIILVLMLAGGAYYVSNNKTTKPNTLDNSQSDNTNNSNSNPTNNPTSTVVTISSGSSTYSVPVTLVTNPNKDNTATGQAVAKTLKSSVTYQVPEEHSETLSVTATVKNGLVSDISFTENPSNKESREFYQSFSQNFNKSAVVGKKLSDISLSRVGGASLTTAAFNSAIAKLSSQQ